MQSLQVPRWVSRGQDFLGYRTYFCWASSRCGEARSDAGYLAIPMCGTAGHATYIRWPRDSLQLNRPASVQEQAPVVEPSDKTRPQVSWRNGYKYPRRSPMWKAAPVAQGHGL